MFSSPEQLDLRFFGYIQSRSLSSVRTGDVVDALGITPIQERKLLSRLSRRGLIVRVRRGLYLAPPRIPAGGQWSPGEALALTTLMTDCDGLYQICGPNAFVRYGWDEQIPTRLYVYNNRLSGERQIGAVAITLMQVATERLGATETVTTPDGIDLVYSSRVRSLMDAVYDWSRFNTLPRAYGWIETELRQDETLAARLIDVTLRYGNQGTLRRIGKLLEITDALAPLLRKIHRALRPSSGLIPWIPTAAKRGALDRRWGLIINDGT